MNGCNLLQDLFLQEMTGFILNAWVISLISDDFSLGFQWNFVWAESYARASVSWGLCITGAMMHLCIEVTLQVLRTLQIQLEYN